MNIKKENVEQMLKNIDKTAEQDRFQALQMVMAITGYQQNINVGLNKQPLSIGENKDEFSAMIDKYIEDNTVPHPDFDRTGVPDCIKVSLLHGQPVFNQTH